MAWQPPEGFNSYQGPVTSGGPPEVGSTYGQYTPQTFAQQGAQTSFGGQAAGQTTWAQPSGGGGGSQPQQQVGQQATPASWGGTAAQWQQNQQGGGYNTGVNGGASQGYTPQGYSQPGQAWVQPQTAAPFGGWNQQQAQQAQGAQNPSQAIADAYRRYLGREATAQEIAERVNQRGFDLNTHIEAIARSQEAYDFYQRQQQGGGQQQQQGGGPGSQPALDSRGWDTDQFSAPRYIAQRPAGHPPPGWDREKWNNPQHQTPKYVIGRILSQYSPSIENLGRAAAEIAMAYPGAQFNGKDKIMVPGVGTMDVLGNSGTGDPSKMNWRFGADDAGGGGGQPAQGGGGYYDPMQQMMQLLQQQGYFGQGGQMLRDPKQEAEMAAMKAQLAQYQQQMATQQAQQAAAAQAQRNRGPQFSYY